MGNHDETPAKDLSSKFARLGISEDREAGGIGFLDKKEANEFT
jgi:hypothetical protein